MAKNKHTVTAETESKTTTVTVDDHGNRRSKEVVVDDPKKCVSMLVELPDVVKAADLQNVTVGGKKAKVYAFSRSEQTAESQIDDLAVSYLSEEDLSGTFIAVEMTAIEAAELVPVAIVDPGEEGEQQSWAETFVTTESLDGLSCLVVLAPRVGPRAYNSSKTTDGFVRACLAEFGTENILTRLAYHDALQSAAYSPEGS